MNRLTKILAVALMLLAILMAAFAWWLGQKPAPPPISIESNVVDQGKSFPAIAAAKKLSKGTRIERDDIKFVTLPIQAPETFYDADEIIGRVTASEIDSDTLITNRTLLHGIAQKLAIGERAVAVPVDEVVGVGNKIAAGDYVDVFITLKQGNDIDKGQARLIASRRHVLAYGTAVMGETESRGGIGSNNQSAPAQARTAVLATPVEDVNQLLLAAQNGKLTLALRHPADNGIADPALFADPRAAMSPKNTLSATAKETLKTVDNQAFSGIDLSSWAGNGNASHPYQIPKQSNPAKASKNSTATLEVIRGTQRESVNF